MDEQTKTKICSNESCDLNGIPQSLANFSKNKATRDGLQYKCKKCVSVNYKKYYNNNESYFTEKHKRYYNEHKDAISKRGKKYRELLGQTLKDRKKKSRERYKEQQKIKTKNYYYNNREIILKKAKENREQINKRNKERLMKNPECKLIRRRRKRRREALRQQRTRSAIQDLSCTPSEWRKYLETKFDENMTWDNYGSYWHVDEIIPCSAWDMSNPEHQKACFHYLNSQPLEARANLRKGGANRKDYTAEIEQFLMVLRALDIL